MGSTGLSVARFLFLPFDDESWLLFRGVGEDAEDVGGGVETSDDSMSTAPFLVLFEAMIVVVSNALWIVRDATRAAPPEIVCGDGFPNRCESLRREVF